MISKKSLIIIYSVLFAVIVLISAAFAFSVSKIDTEFTFFGDDKVKSEEINAKLSSFLGKNLLFLDTDEIIAAVNEDPVYDCVLAKKSFPDSVKVVVKERREVYLISYAGENFIADENGFVFKKYTGEKTRDLISLSFKNVEEKKPTVGEYLKIDYDNSLKNAFKIAESVDLTDKISEMRLVKNYSGDLTSFDIEFTTYTNVVIRIKKSDDEGEIKAKAAFSAYDLAEDYEKSSYFIEAYKNDDGQVKLVWTRYGE